ncbi:hypothetical protein [Flagellimonas profundi]|uniref:Lipoprotein n=1 Tax=Flagellimonas profundi TaxID=2915620 RepID=A0ABS3FDA4_9FLAO|nr:hypothetical protein [Allomuricauda profundi]MBO0341097.1 hypothetical protein [Allomuricauda profundi]
MPGSNNSISGTDSISNLFIKLNQLDTEDTDFYEQAVTINQKIAGFLNAIDHPDTVYEFLKEDIGEELSIAISRDTSIIAFSWDTRLGGSSPEVKSIVLYSSTHGLESFVLNEASPRFTDIYTLDRKTQEPVYLFKGSGRSSVVDIFISLNAFVMDNNGLKKAHIFPENQHSMYINHILDDPMDFIVIDGASKIYIPNKAYPDNNWGLTYEMLYFNGKSYQQEMAQIDEPLIEGVFNGVENYENGFLNGSEKPIVTIQNGDSSSYKLIFKDSTKIDYSYNPNEEITELKIKANYINQPPIVLSYSAYNARLLAKQNQYLFVELSGTPTSSPLLIYDIQKQQYVSSISQSGIKLYEDALLFAQPISQMDSLGNKPNCNPAFGDQTSYYKTFLLEYRSTYPTVKATGQTYCGFAE